MMFELASNGPVVARISLILYILPLVYSMDNILSEWTIVGGRTLNGLGSEVSMTGSTCALGQNGGSFISDEEDKGLFTGGAGKQFVTTDASLIPKVSIANAIYPYTGEFAASKPVHAWAGVPGLEEASVGVLVGSSFVSKAWVDLNTAEKVSNRTHIFVTRIILIIGAGRDGAFPPFIFHFNLTPHRETTATHCNIETSQ